MNQEFPKNVNADPDGPAAAAPVAVDAGMPDTQHTIGVYRIELEMQNAELCRVHEELEAAKARYFDLYDTASVGFCEIGKDGLIRQANQATALLLEMDSHHLVRKPFINFIHREDLLIYQRVCIQIEETGASQFCELRLKRHGKDPLWVELRGAWKIGESGEGEMRLAINDINARKLLEVQFRQSQKMQAFGQLAGGVAHDFNNIIATILMQVDMLNLLPFQSSEESEGLLQIRTDALRAADLTRQLLTFSRKQVPRFVELDLNQVIRKLVQMSRRIVGDQITLEADLSPGPLVTLADAGMLDQLMMNLVGNAMDAMPDGGRISVRTEERTLTPEEARSIPEGRPGSYVVLMVSDNGCGIPPEILSQIFEPFFTTKEEGKGTGLGLATVYGIVSQHQGFLLVRSTVGSGTSFQIFLPASSARLAAPVAPITPTKSIGGRETILLVEDQATLRKLTGMLLEAHGYRVLYAADGVEALEVCGRHPGRIDLLLTDLQMPGGMGGLELGDRLSALCADLRIIFVSGGTVDTTKDGLCLSSKRIFVGKPIQPGALLEQIRTCLDA